MRHLARSLHDRYAKSVSPSKETEPSFDEKIADILKLSKPVTKKQLEKRGGSTWSEKVYPLQNLSMNLDS